MGKLAQPISPGHAFSACNGIGVTRWLKLEWSHCYVPILSIQSLSGVLDPFTSLHFKDLPTCTLFYLLCVLSIYQILQHELDRIPSPFSILKVLPGPRYKRRNVRNACLSLLCILHRPQSQVQGLSHLSLPLSHTGPKSESQVLGGFDAHFF